MHSASHPPRQVKQAQGRPRSQHEDRSGPGAGDRPPLIELHLHLEGCLSAARARQLWALRPEVGNPPASGLEDERWKVDDLSSFLKLFGWAVRLLDGPQAYGFLLDDTIELLEAQGVIYAELFVAVGVMHFFGQEPRPIFELLANKARARAKAGGVDLRFIADGVRQFGVEAAWRVLDDALALRENRIVGFGLGGDELAVAATEFSEIYEKAGEAGLGTSIHAGEGDRPEAVAEALQLGVDRIGHGIAAASDPFLLRQLAAAPVVLEVCPGSNRATGVWPEDRGPHPIHVLAEAGVKLCLGSDDPSFFDTALVKEWEHCRGEGIPERRLREWNENAARAAFLPEDERGKLLERMREG